MSEFGPVAYGVFVRDKLTGHPRGTGFVQFRSFEAASAAVNTVRITFFALMYLSQTSLQ